MTATVEASGRSIEISHAERVVFPGAGLTKLDLAGYYARVAEAMLPHVRDRPLALESFPNGVDHERYYLKNVPSHYPSWVATTRVPRREGGSIRQALIGLESVDGSCHEFGGDVHAVSSVCPAAFEQPISPKRLKRSLSCRSRR